MRKTVSERCECVGIAAEGLKVFAFDLPKWNLIAYHPTNKELLPMVWIKG
jgi:hypothetical protein